MASFAQQQTARPAAAQSQAQRDTAPQSQTQVLVQSSPETQTPATLRLRGAHPPTSRSVQWREDVVDNEGLGRKRSKGRFSAPSMMELLLMFAIVCCIYHRPKGVDESSDESSSDSSSSDSDSDSGGDASRNRRMDDGKARKHSRDCPDHDHSADHHRHSRQPRRRDGNEPRRRPSPNAYEKVPKSKPRSEAGAGSSTQA